MAGPSRAWLADASPRSSHSAASPHAQLHSSRRSSLAAPPTLPPLHPSTLASMQLPLPSPQHTYAPPHMGGPPGGPVKQHSSPSYSSPYHMPSPHGFSINAPYPGSAYPGSSYEAPPGGIMPPASYQPDEPHPATAARKANGKRARPEEKAEASGSTSARADSSSRTKGANGGGPSQANGKRRKVPQEAPKPASETESESESDDGEDEEQSDVEVKSKGKKKGKAKRNRQACTHCQKLKMKCSGSLGEDQPCERCARTGHQCIVHERTYRRPWTRRMDGQLQELTQKVAVMQAQIAELQQRGPALAPSMPTASSVSALDGQNGVGAAISPHGSNSGPLIFEPDEDVQLVTRRQHELPFIKTGLITPAEAVQHFRRFMDRCLLHVVLIDPEWLTLRRALESSVFLFTTIVWLSSAYDEQRRDLVDVLQPEMDLLIGQVITRGCKSVEVVQGFLLLYFWNRPSAEPDRDRAYLFAGIAIRLAVEKSLHLPQPGEDAGEQRNRERTMIMTFVVDRSLSAAVGKPWTIHADSSQLVMECNSWCEHPMARPWDMGISALADLLKVTSKQTDALRTAVRDWTEDNGDGFDCLTTMKVMNEELEAWRRRWDKSGFFTSPINTELPSASPAPTNATDTTRAGSAGIGGTPSSASGPRPDIHVRTLHYITKQASMRFSFAVLVLNSFGLQYCATRPRKASARTLCVPRAISAAQNVLAAARDGLRGTMALSPHTQFVILSFALVSLIKLSKASPIGDFASELLVADVQSGIDFLDSISMSPTHTPARLASLLRLLLRNSRSGGADPGGEGPDDAGAQRTGSRDGEGSSRTERRSNLKKPAYAPGMEVHRLPSRSSRAVTPHADPDSGSTPSKSPASLMAPTLSFSTPRQAAATATQQRAQGQHVSFSEPQADPAQLLLHFAEPSLEGAHARRPFASGTPSNGVALTPFDDGAYAGPGGGPLSPLPLDFSLLGANGSTSLGHMTAEEILDDSFWLRLG